jgi:hypothetical protein
MADLDKDLEDIFQNEDLDEIIAELYEGKPVIKRPVVVYRRNRKGRTKKVVKDEHR